MPTPEEQVALDAAAAAAAAAKKVEFSPEQQEHINKMFNSRFAKVTEKHEQELKLMSEELEKVKATVVKPPVVTSPNTPDENVRQMQEFLSQEKETSKGLRAALDTEKSDKLRIIEANKKMLKDQAIHEAASTLPNGVEFHELKTVKKLVEDDIMFDESSRQWIAKENGVIKVNSSMEPMTLTEYFAAYASSHPYLVKGTARGGSGSSESGSGGSTLGGATQVKTKADLSVGSPEQQRKAKVEYISKFGYGAWEKLPTGVDAAQQIRAILANAPRR